MTTEQVSQLDKLTPMQGLYSYSPHYICKAAPSLSYQCLPPTSISPAGDVTSYNHILALQENTLLIQWEDVASQFLMLSHRHMHVVATSYDMTQFFGYVQFIILGHS